MTGSTIFPELRESSLFRLIAAARQVARPSGLREMLRVIAEETDAFGCILWEEAPVTQWFANPPIGRLFALAHWLRDPDVPVFHYLPLQSATGNAILTPATRNVQDVYTDPLVLANLNPDWTFFQRTGIKTLCSTPVFIGPSRAAVNIYRTEPRPFSRHDVERLEQLTALIPGLYESLVDRVNFNLLQHVNEIFGSAVEDVPKALRSVVESVAETFNGLEVSIFVEDAIERPGSYELAATNWARPEELRKTSYRKGEGLAGYALAHARAVRIFDLGRFGEDLRVIREEYPGIEWNDSSDIVTAASRELKPAHTGGLPPLSYMCAPIINDRRVLGVITCSVAKGVPRYFDDRQLSCLQLVASQIGSWWDNWMRLKETERENLSWRALVESVTRMNRFVHRELNRPTPSERSIFAETMRVAGSILPGAEIMDVRLLDATRQELYFAEVHGSEWDRGSKSQIATRKNRRFPVTGKPSSAGAYVIQTRQAYVVLNAQTDPYYSETFPATKRMITAPISSGETIFGVLDIAATTEWEFPKYARQIAELLGQQLGLYHYLATEIAELNRVKSDLSKAVNRQHEIYQDFQHQLQSPVTQAHRTVQDALEIGSPEDSVRGYLFRLRGLCRKAERVTRNVGLFAALASGEPIKLNLRPLKREDIVRKLIEAAKDNELMVDPRRNVQFQVDSASFEILRQMMVEADHDLLEQALNNLMDNAGKYSYARTKVKISGGSLRKWFYISVVNQGLRIQPGDIQYVGKRGWRSELAKRSTGEGSGIGLWIVDNVMRAHDGELTVIPTTEQGITEVRLVFPKTKIEGG